MNQIHKLVLLPVLSIYVLGGTLISIVEMTPQQRKEGMKTVIIYAVGIGFQALASALAHSSE